MAELSTIEAEQRRLDARRLAVLGEAEARAVTVRQVGVRTKAWLLHEHHLAGATAARWCATANKLRLLLSETADALAAGVISFDHAALVAKLCVPRVEDIVVLLQPRFIELAQVMRFEQWAHEVRGLISLADQDGPGPLGEPRNRLRMTDGLDGALHIHIDIDLVGAQAAAVRASLLDEAERRYRAHHRKNGTVAGGADADSTDGADNTDGDGEVGCCDPTMSFDQFPGRSELLAEALVELVAKGVMNIAGNKSPVTDVALIVNSSGPLNGRTPDGVRLQDRTTRQLLCDSVFHAVVVDHLGVPIDLGHAARFFTPHQRRAIMIRDGGCGHPRCNKPWDWCQLHHVEEWDADGGPTDQANALPACTEHHTLWHSDGWSVAPDPDTHHLDQGFIITNPDGRILRSQRNGQTRPLVLELGLDPLGID